MTDVSTRPGEPVLSVEDLTVTFEVRSAGRGARVSAVDGVTFDVAPGEIVGLVGESGSGKSTLARAALGLVPVDRGKVSVQGVDLGSLRRSQLRKYRRHMQMVFQDPYSSLDPSSLVGDSIAEPLITHEKLSVEERHELIGGLLDVVGLPRVSASRYPGQFSGGQRQRIAIARAIALHPSLVVCDEAVSALDVSTQNQILNLLLDLREQFNLAYLFIGHDLAVIRQLSQRVLVMYLGQLVEEGPAERVMTRPGHPYTAALLSAIPASDPREARQRARIVVRGDAPNPINPPSGCRFHMRCPFVMDICRIEKPASFPVKGGGSAACHLHTVGPALAGESVLGLEPTVVSGT